MNLELIEKLAQVKEYGFSVIIDETTDLKGDMPIIVLLQPSLYQFSQPVMIDLIFQSEVASGTEHGTNNIDIQHVYFISLTEKKIPLHSIDAFVVDGAAYMKTSYTQLSRNYPRLIFIWCLCHMLNRLYANIYDMPEFSDIRTLMKNLKKLFTNSNIRKKKWKSFCNGGNHMKLYCLTRWASWILAIEDVLKHIDIIPSFCKELREFYALKNKTVTVVENLIQQFTNIHQIKMKMKLLCEFLEIHSLIKTFESNGPQIHKAGRYITQLLATFDRCSKSRELSTILLEQLETDVVNPDTFKEACTYWNKFKQNIYLQLKIKLNDLLLRQPYWNFICICKIFDSNLSKDNLPEQLISVVTLIPFLLLPNEHENIDFEKKRYYIRYSDELEEEYQLYKSFDLVDSDIFQFWLNVPWKALSNLAIRCLSIPVSSSDCERGFSIYNRLMKDKVNATFPHKKALTLAKFNSNRL